MADHRLCVLELGEVQRERFELEFISRDVGFEGGSLSSPRLHVFYDLPCEPDVVLHNLLVVLQAAEVEIVGGDDEPYLLSVLGVVELCHHVGQFGQRHAALYGPASINHLLRLECEIVHEVGIVDVLPVVHFPVAEQSVAEVSDAERRPDVEQSRGLGGSHSSLCCFHGGFECLMLWLCSSAKEYSWSRVIRV